MNLKKLMFSLAFIALITACNKENITAKSLTAATESSNNVVANVCDNFVYTDTIFYLKQSGTDYIVKPLTRLIGTFGAYPTGLLNINATTGAINVTKSATGLKYLVWYIATGSVDTCKKFVTISGVDYTDSVYTLNKLSASANPIYNANALQPVNCATGCSFDDGGSAAALGIAVNKTTGKIDLKKTVQNGVFGATPVNGSFKDFTLNYRIGDKSSKALNSMPLRLYYYSSKSKIPAKLLEDVSNKNSQVFGSDDTNPDDDGGHHHGGGDFSAVGNTQGFTGTSSTISKGDGTTKCRPPYIIVTAN